MKINTFTLSVLEALHNILGINFIVEDGEVKKVTYHG